MTELHLSVCSLLLVLVRHREGTRPRPAATTLKSYWRYNGSCLPSGKPIAHVCPRFRDTYGINSIDPSSHVGFYWGGGGEVVDESEFELFDVNHQKSGAFLCGSPGFHFCAGSPAVCALVGGAEVDSDNWVELNEIALRNGSHNLF